MPCWLPVRLAAFLCSSSPEPFWKKKKKKRKKGIKSYCSSICFATKQQGIPLAELQGQLSFLFVMQSPRVLNMYICRKQFSNLSPILLTDYLWTYLSDKGQISSGAEFKQKKWFNLLTNKLLPDPQLGTWMLEAIGQAGGVSQLYSLQTCVFHNLFFFSPSKISKQKDLLHHVLSPTLLLWALLALGRVLPPLRLPQLRNPPSPGHQYPWSTAQHTSSNLHLTTG